MIGIYCIENKLNDKVYIGQSWVINARWYRHRTNKNTNNANHLYSSMRKYGIENFEFFVLKEIIEDDSTQGKLDYYEDYYIRKFNSLDRRFGYNKKGGGSRGLHSEESKEKNRKSHVGKSINAGIPKTEEAKRNMSLHHADVSGSNNPMFGRKHTPETILKISEKAQKRVGIKNPFYGKHHSESNKRKFGENARNQHGNRVFCQSNNKSYRSLREAGRALNLDRRKISEVCRGLIREVKGFRFQYIEKV